MQYSRMKRFRDALPAVIRPDVIPTQDGMAITELDSVPGGIGLTACLSHIYHDLDSGDSHLIGGRDGMVRGFARMLRSAQGEHEGGIAILVSEESKDYRPEMSWLAAQLREEGMPVWCVEPREIRFTENGLRLHINDGEQPISVIYRFYELFDLLNIPKAELVQYAAKKAWVSITPPYKPALEEKSAFALLHHPMLRPFWEKELGADCLLHLSAIMPKTWLLDPAPLPAIATIPGLRSEDERWQIGPISRRPRRKSAISSSSLPAFPHSRGEAAACRSDMICLRPNGLRRPGTRLHPSRPHPISYKSSIRAGCSTWTIWMKAYRRSCACPGGRDCLPITLFQTIKGTHRHSGDDLPGG